MDECLSWQAKLAKSNINILGVTDGVATIEFTYHPKPGVFKWCKTLINVEDTHGLEVLGKSWRGRDGGWR